MHPAYSVIFFTTASGLGYGLLFVLSVYAAFGLLPQDVRFGFAGLGIAVTLIVSGLLSSTFHLGHPERAWRALSQWRSSWLSREGVAAVATFVPLAVFAAGWLLFGRTTGWWSLAGLGAAAGSAATVYCTGKIYATLPAVPRWSNRWVVPNYLTMALMTGIVWFDALLGVAGVDRPEIPLAALAALAAGLAVKTAYWRDIARTTGALDVAAATGLRAFSDVRLLDPPHTGANYLQREMGYRIARKHAAKLRRIAILGAYVVPLATISVGPWLPPAMSNPISILGGIVCIAGTVVERWLFFAEAQHVVTLYYGARAA
jgi:DMSO reductase anchor subunit